MQLYSLKDRILGSLIGAGAGDGMGAATEARTTEQIKEYFGNLVTDFTAPPPDTFGAGNKPGQVTDDFSSAYYLAAGIADNYGVTDTVTVQKALIEWSKKAVFFDRFAGPTTRLAIRRCMGEQIPASSGVVLTSRQATNGSAMRIGPVGLFHPGNLKQTIEDSITVTMVTHDNFLAISGACAVSCAVNQALLTESDLYSVLQASLYGAREGERLGREIASDIPGPSVVKRLEIAIDIGLGKGSPEEKMKLLGERIGSGLHIAEAVPTAIGFVAANPNDAMGALIGAVNVGYDTDTVATMTGAITGALYGAAAFPDHFLPVLEEANSLNIQALAKKITNLAQATQQEGK